VYLICTNVSSQNNRYWSYATLNLIYKFPFHDGKAGLWCAMTAERSTSFIFYAETFYFDKYEYMRHTLTELSVQLREDKWYCAWFQQDLATFHTADESLAALKSVQKSKSAPLHAMKALGGRGGIGPTHSRTQH
jgi:hypothetical protein